MNRKMVKNCVAENMKVKSMKRMDMVVSEVEDKEETAAVRSRRQY